MKNEFPVLPTHSTIDLECCTPALAIDIKRNIPVILIKLYTEVLIIYEDRISWILPSYIKTNYSIIKHLTKNERVLITI